MGTINCEIIRDLLPLYADDSLSEPSCELVKEHLESCEDCRKLYKYMNTNIELPKDRANPSQSLKTFKRQTRKLTIEIVLVTVLFMALVSLFCMLPFLKNEIPYLPTSLQVSEDAAGTKIRLTDTVKGKTLYYMYQITDEDEVILYLTFGSRMNQYFFQLSGVVNRSEGIDYDFEPYYLDTGSGNVSLEGGPEPRGGTWAFDYANSISLGTMITKVYYFDDNDNQIWDSYIECMKENMNPDQSKAHYIGETAYISTDGFGFGDIEGLILLWEK